MFISKIIITNYRAVKDTRKINLTRFSSIGGKNDAGKTIVLNAIATFLEIKSFPITLSDFNRYLFDPEDSTPLTPTEEAHHYLMAEKYVNSMAALLYNVATQSGINTSPDNTITLLEYCKDIFWGSLQQTSGLEPPNPSRATQNSNREYENSSNGTNKKGC